MRLFTLIVSCFLTAAMLTTCRQKDLEPDYLADGTLRLKSISFSGIPHENISIDQKNRVINVNMPSVLLDQIGVTVEPNDDAEWENKTDYLSAAVFGCNPCYQLILRERNAPNNYQKKGFYTIQTIATAPLNVALLTQPITHLIRDGQDDLSALGIDFPMVNLYGNKLPKEAHLTYDATGEELIIKRDSTGSSFFGIHYSSLSNRLGIFLFDEKLLPGSYHIELILDDGSRLKVPQPLLVSKGGISFDNEAQKYFGYRVVAGKSITLKGYNLFEGDISLKLVNQEGKVYALSGLLFERYGQLLQVPVPAGLASGQYILQVYVKGVKQDYCLRVNILRDDKEHPILGTLVTKDPREASPCSLLEPVTAQRGIALFLTTNRDKQILDKLAQHLTLKLVSAANGTAYYATVAPFDYTNPSLLSSFTIPTTVLLGLYTATLQVLDAKNNVVDESEPYGRILDVK